MGIPYERFSCFRSKTIRAALERFDDEMVALEAKASTHDTASAVVQAMKDLVSEKDA